MRAELLCLSVYRTCAAFACLFCLVLSAQRQMINEADRNAEEKAWDKKSKEQDMGVGNT